MRFKDMFNEMAYPKSFSFEEFGAISTYAGKQRYAENHLKRLGSGSARVVYQIDDEKVLKLAKNRKGLAQNEVELDWGLQQYGTVAKIYESDEDKFYWLEMQLAKKLNVSDFESINEVSWKDYIKFLDILESKRNDARYKSNPKDEQLFEDLYENEYCSGMASMIGDYDMPIGDLRRKNSYGIVKNDGREDIVLVDFGLNKDVHYKYYSV